MKVCVITGQGSCKCKNVKGKIIVDPVDYRLAMRFVFSDHSWYTNMVILESLPVLQPNAEFAVKRVLMNPVQIKQLLLPLVGAIIADNFESAVSGHLKLANAALEPLRNDDKVALAEAVNNFYAQGNDFGAAIYSLNPKMITLEAADAMVREHNEFVVKLATLRKQQNYEEYITTTDMYNKHMMMVADLICELIKSR